jgi:hypothetical protein
MPPRGTHNLNLKKVDLICEALSKCASTEDAAKYAGIGERTYNYYMKRGVTEFELAGLDPEELPDDWEEIVDKKEWIFCVLYQCANLARAEAHVTLLGTMMDAAPEDWRAAAKLLAVRRPDHYAERRRFEHSGPKGKPISVDVYDAIRIPAEEDEENEREQHDEETTKEVAPST